MFILDLVKLLINAFAQAASDVFSSAGELVGFGLILTLGWIVAIQLANVARKLGEILQLEELLDRAGVVPLAQHPDLPFALPEMLAQLVKWLVVLFFFVAACYVLHVPFITGAMHAMTLSLPRYCAGLLVIICGAAVAKVAREMVTRRMSAYRAAFGNLAFAVIMGGGTFLALAVAGIPFLYLTILFAAIMLALSLGCGLAIGLGGRDITKHWLDSWFIHVATTRTEKAGNSLRDFTDPARTIVPRQGDISSVPLREFH